MVSSSTAATLVGVAVAAGTAAQPVLNAVQGTMNTGDWTNLAAAVGMAIFGWFTRFKTKTP